MRLSFVALSFVRVCHCYAFGAVVALLICLSVISCLVLWILHNTELAIHGCSPFGGGFIQRISLQRVCVVHWIRLCTLRSEFAGWRQHLEQKHIKVRFGFRSSSIACPAISFDLFVFPSSDLVASYFTIV